MGSFIDLTGRQFGEWKALRYLGNSLWECQNPDGKVKDIHSYTLRTKYGSYERKRPDDIPSGFLDKTFNSWTVLEYVGSQMWKCRCECGNIQVISSYNLLNNKSRSCNECRYKRSRKDDFTGKHIGEWTVLKYVGNGRWHCRCSCGKERDILGRDLRNKTSTSCGHDRNYHIIKKDIAGEVFGFLKVIEYTGHDQLWKCECICKNICEVSRDSLVSGKTRSCGCLKEALRKETLLGRYGDSNTTRIDSPRELWQIEVISSKEGLSGLISSLNHSPTASELSDILNVNDTTILKALKRFDMSDIVRHNTGTSDMEIDLMHHIEDMGCKVITGDRKILSGQELDLYIPDKKLAIEFNGTYWHSDIYKEPNYHQKKTIACINKRIHLVHVFEYEWRDEHSREKILNHIKSIVNARGNTRVYARKTNIQHISNQECKEFLDKYHLQGNTGSEIKLGCIYKGEIVGVMTFGRPRFSSNFQYELIRLCWKSGTAVIGGSEKLFKYFIDTYQPESIVSYCDLTKFIGNVYLKLGFKTDLSQITEPNYVWVKSYTNEVLTRYQTMKKDLIAYGLGNAEQTEAEIMSSLNFVRVYNSGNLRFIWNR